MQYVYFITILVIHDNLPYNNNTRVNARNGLSWP